MAVADHNSAEWVDKIKEAALGKPLTVFPGVEITVSDGFHIIALFDVDRDRDYIVAFLGAIQIKPSEYGATTTSSKIGSYEVIEQILKWHGLPILAHIDSHKGAFKELRGNDLTSLFNKANYAAVETSTGDLPSGFDLAHGFTKSPTCYQASDNPDPIERTKHSEKGLGTNCSFFKLETPINLDGIKQCFIDPSVRIRKHGSRINQQYPHIISISASSGFISDQKILFHPGLNSIIGGKGVGKSLLIELIRFVFGQPSTIPIIADDHDSKIKKMLGELNSVAATFQMASGDIYEVKRTYKATSSEFEIKNISSGKKENYRICDFFPILAYSQTEIIEIAKDEGSQLKLIDGFIDHKKYLNAIDEIQSSLIENDRKMAECWNAKQNLEQCEKDRDTCIANISEIEKKLKIVGADLLIYKEHTELEEKKKYFENILDYLSKLQKDLTKHKHDLTKVLTPTIPLELNDSEIHDIYDTVNKIRNQSIDDINGRLQIVIDSITEITEKRKQWMEYYSEKEKAYLEIVASEDERKKDETKRKAFQEELNKAQCRLSQIQTLVSALEFTREERSKLLSELSNKFLEYYAARKQVFDQIQMRSNGRLRLNLHHMKNVKKYSAAIKKELHSNNIRSTEFDNIATNISPSEFISLVLNKDKDNLKIIGKITDSTAEKVIGLFHLEDKYEQLFSLEHNYYPEDVPEIQFKKPSGAYAPLNELSIGQKCTALLIVGLSDGTRPVIIDQPEDSLDITTVWEDISLKLRDAKDRRQFIVTTHNASVGVASDSDMFIEIRSTSKKATVNCWGGIEDKQAREAVLTNLEGGLFPINLRLQKYNLNHQ